MATIRDFEDARKKRMRKRNFRRLSILATICAFILVVIGIQNLLTGIPLLSMIRTNFSLSGQQGEYPVELPGLHQYGVTQVRNNVAVFSETYLYVYDRSGKQVLRTTHGLDDPKYFAVNDNIIYYKVGGNYVNIQNMYGDKSVLELDKRIVDVAYSDNGQMAVAVQSDQHTSYAEVYDKNQEPVFSARLDRDYQIWSVGFTPNQKGILIVSWTAEGGMITSRIAMYELNQEEPVFLVNLKGTFALSAEYHGNSLVVVGEDKTLTLDSQGEITGQYSYQNKPLLKFDNTTQQGAILILSDYGENMASTMVSLDESCGVRAATTLTSRVLDIEIDRNTEYILTQGYLIWFSDSGEELGKLEVEGDSLGFIVIDRVAYILGANQLTAVELK